MSHDDKGFKKKLQEKFKKTIEEYSDIEMNPTSFGITTIPKRHLKPEWETGLSDTLFGTIGFSHFFGALAFRCQFKWTLSISTAAAGIENGKFYIFINPLFFYDVLPKHQHRVFVVVHEVFHVFYEHADRGEEMGYDADLFNEACDYYIHSVITAMRKASAQCNANLEMIPKDIFPICYHERYDALTEPSRMTEEEIYKDLVENGSPEKSNGGTGGDGIPGEAFDDTPMSADKTDAAKSRSAVEKATTIRAAAASAQQNGGVGDSELGIIRKFIELTESKVDWRDECSEYFETVRDVMITYSHYNRRSTDDLIFPSKTGEFIRIFFGVDTSGSMGQADLNMAASELHGFLEQVDNWEIEVASSDIKAYRIATFSSDEEDSIENVEVDFKGGGGTRMSSMIEMAQDEEEWEEPFNLIVIITDGYLQKNDIIDEYDGETPLLVIVTEQGNVPEWLSEEVKCIQMSE